MNAAREAARLGAELARSAGERRPVVVDEETQATALASIALSLSAMATVLLATLDEDASHG